MYYIHYTYIIFIYLTITPAVLKGRFGDFMYTVYSINGVKTRIWNKDFQTKISGALDYLDMFMEHSFYPQITLSTRLTNTKGTLLDNFLCKLCEATLNTTTAGVLINKCWDHQPYFMLLDNIDRKILVPTYIKVSKQDTLFFSKCKNEIIASDELHSLTRRPEEDPNVTYSVLHAVIQNANDRHIPSKLVNFDKYKK